MTTAYMLLNQRLLVILLYLADLLGHRLEAGELRTSQDGISHGIPVTIGDHLIVNERNQQVGVADIVHQHLHCAGTWQSRRACGGKVGQLNQLYNNDIINERSKQGVFAVRTQAGQ